MSLRRIAVGAALIAAPLAFAAPAMADNTTPSFECSSPCVNRTISAPADPAAPLLGAPWNQIWPGGSAKGPWENAFSSDLWGKTFDPAGNGVGAWEKVFGKAPE
jgi:hypothetical protein